MKKIYIADPDVMEEWNYLLYKPILLGDGLSIRYRRTTHAICQNLYYNEKSIGCVYIFGLKRYPDERIHGYVARVYVNKNFRHSHKGSLMMMHILKQFGHCVLHISSASPNRIDGLTDENREEYRNKLYKFYKRFGFHRTSEKHTGMIRYPYGDEK